MTILEYIKGLFQRREKSEVPKRENSLAKRHTEFLIQQNNELGSRLQTLYQKLSECNDSNELPEINDEINHILIESDRLMRRIQKLRELE